MAAGLAALGAGRQDADAIAREVLEPDGPAFAAVVERFGPGIVGTDGRIDRAGLAAVVFADPEARSRLEAATHPLIAERMLSRALEEEAAGREVLVLEVPLLDRSGRERYGLDVVVVVDTPVEVAVARLMAGRGFDEADARARVAAQASREQRLAFADRVVDNSGSQASLDAEVGRTWEWLERLARGAGTVLER